MKVDRDIGAPMRTAGPQARSAEAAGYDGVWTAETAHDPFLPLLLASESTDRVDIGTSIAVAFARSPMLLASSTSSPSRISLYAPYESALSWEPIREELQSVSTSSRGVARE